MSREPDFNFVEKQRTPDDFVYLLVDGLADCALSHPLSVPSLIESLGAAAVTRVLRPDLDHTPDACPALIQLARPGEPVSPHYLKLSVDYADWDQRYNKRYVCGWLISPQPLETVAAEIASMCRTTALRYGPSLPWFEPLSLELLTYAVGGRAGSLLPQISAWLYPACWAGHGVLRRSSYPVDAELLGQIQETLQLAPLICEFLGIWRHTLTLPVDFAPWRWNGASVLPPRAGAHAYNLIRTARALGVHDTRNIIALCLHQVFIHPDLKRHPEIQDLMAKGRSGAINLQSHFASHHNAAKWKSIGVDLPNVKDYS